MTNTLNNFNENQLAVLNYVQQDKSLLDEINKVISRFDDEAVDDDLLFFAKNLLNSENYYFFEYEYNILYTELELMDNKFYDKYKNAPVSDKSTNEFNEPYNELFCETMKPYNKKFDIYTTKLLVKAFYKQKIQQYKIAMQFNDIL